MACCQSKIWDEILTTLWINLSKCLQRAKLSKTGNQKTTVGSPHLELVCSTCEVCSAALGNVFLIYLYTLILNRPHLESLFRVRCTSEHYTHHPCQKAHHILMVWWQPTLLCKSLFRLPLRPQEATNPSETLWTFTTGWPTCPLCLGFNQPNPKMATFRKWKPCNFQIQTPPRFFARPNPH